MSLYSIKDTTLAAIGDAIRAKNGTEDKYKPTEMAEAIAAIVGGGGGTVKYVQLTNEDGAKTTQVFDASPYIGTEDNKEFIIVAWSNYSNSNNTGVACKPNILLYDGAAYSDLLSSANSMNVSYFINPAKCTLVNGVISLTRNGSDYFKLNDSSTSNTNYLELIYCESTGSGGGGGGGPEFVVTNGELAENFYSIDAADIEPFTFVDYFEGGAKGPDIQNATTSLTAATTEGLNGTTVYPWGDNSGLVAISSTTSHTLKVVKTIVNNDGTVSYGSATTLGSTKSGDIHDAIALNSQYMAVIYGDSAGNVKCCILSSSGGSTSMSKYNEITLATGCKSIDNNKKVAIGLNAQNKKLVAFYLDANYKFTFHPITWNGTTTLTAGTAFTWAPSDITFGSYCMIQHAQFYECDSIADKKLLFIIDGNIGSSSSSYKQFHKSVQVYATGADGETIYTSNNIASVVSNKFCYNALTIPVEDEQFLHIWDTENDDYIHASFVNTTDNNFRSFNVATPANSMARVLDIAKVGEGLVALVHASTNSALSCVLCEYDTTGTRDFSRVYANAGQTIHTTSSVASNAFGTFVTPFENNKILWYYQDKNKYLKCKELTFDENHYIVNNQIKDIVSIAIAVPNPTGSPFGFKKGAGVDGGFFFPYFNSTTLYYVRGAYFEKSTVKELNLGLASSVAVKKLGITKTKCGVDAPGAIYKYVK